MVTGHQGSAGRQIVMDHHSRLDAVRGAAAIIVLVAHVNQIFWVRLFGMETFFTDLVGSSARYAVIAFFILSGYLITESIRQNVARNGVFSWLDFLIARIARIYPPLIAAVMIAVGTVGIVAALDLPLRLAGDLYAARDTLTISAFEIGTTLLGRRGLTNLMALMVPCGVFTLRSTPICSPWQWRC